MFDIACIGLEIFWLLTGLVLHIAWTRKSRAKEIRIALRLFVMIILGSNVSSLFILRALNATIPDSISGMLGIQFVVACAWYVYISFVNIPATSVRIKILRTIQSQQPEATVGSLNSAYDLEHVLRLRLIRLVANGHIAEKNSKFVLAKRQLFVIASFLACLKALLYNRGTHA